jgi:O-antigen ligase
MKLTDIGDAPAQANRSINPGAPGMTSRLSARVSSIWLSLLILASVISVPAPIRIALFGGLVSLRPFAIVLICVVIFQVLSSYRYGWQTWNPITVLLALVALEVLVRSSWPLIWSDPEPVFVDRTGFTGSPSWAGAIHSKGLVTSLLLLTYVAVAVVAATFASQRQLGEILVSRAATTLLWSITVFALLFLMVLALSIAANGLDPALWTVVIRGIDVSRSSSDQTLLGVGPDEGVIFAAGAVMAASRAALRSKERKALSLSAVVQLTAAVLTFSRGAWLTAFIGLLALLLIKSRTSRILIAPFIVTCGLVLLALITLVQSIQGNTIARLVLVGSSGTGDARLEQWWIMLNLLLQQPLVGYGAEGYRPYTSGFPAENFILEIAFSGGVIVVVFWVVGQIAIARRFLTSLKTLRSHSDDSVIPLALALASFTVGTMLNTSGWTPIYWLVMGLVVGSLQRVALPQPSLRSRQRTVMDADSPRRI